MGTIISLLGVVIALFALLLFIPTAYLVIMHRRYAYIPSPKGASFYMGHIAVLQKATNKGKLFFDLLIDWYYEAGPVFLVWLFHEPVVVGAEADCIKALSTRAVAKSGLPGLNWVFGQRFILRSSLTIPRHEDWKSRRKTLDPSFAKSHLNGLVPQFNAVAIEYCRDNLRSRADGKTVVDMHDVFRRTTLQVISLVCFGMDFSKDPYVKSLTGDRGLLYLIPNTLEGTTKMRNPLERYIRFGKNRTYAETALKVRQIGEYCIRKRLAALENKEEVPQDLLTLILRTVQIEKNIEMEELVDEFVTFYIAGQESSANMLAFTTVYLLQNPDVLERVMEEIEEVVGDKPSIEADDMDKLTYLQQVFEEVLRLHPPGAVLSKIAPKGLTLNGYSIPEGTRVWIALYVVQHLAKYFDEPEKFKPSRFAPGQQRPSPYVYLPFGIGHRTCIGKLFSMMEAKAVMVHLLRTYHLTLPEDYKLEVGEAVVIHLKGGLPCTLVPRK